MYLCGCHATRLIIMDNICDPLPWDSHYSSYIMESVNYQLLQQLLIPTTLTEVFHYIDCEFNELAYYVIKGYPTSDNKVKSQSPWQPTTLWSSCQHRINTRVINDIISIWPFNRDNFSNTNIALHQNIPSVAPDQFPTSGVCLAWPGRLQCCLWREGCLGSKLVARGLSALWVIYKWG